MFLLFLTSCIWAFSFPLIGHTLAGIDPVFLAAVRMLISLLVFLPFFRMKHLTRAIATQLMLIGLIQYGLMYIAYLHAYRFLPPHEVALLTIFTPIYTTLFHDLFTRRFHPLFLLTAGLAVIGTGIALYTELQRNGLFAGFLLMQGSNLCFAFGQIHYRQLMRNNPKLSNLQIYALLYAGALLVPALWSGLFSDWQHIQLQPRQWMVLIYLGAIASGLAFFLWNAGARRVDAGALAIFNNLKIPLAITISLLFFGESSPLLRLTIGCSITLAALVINEWQTRRTA